jgi:hypothetical protein
MPNAQSISIPLSKSKLTKGLTGSVLFVLASGWILLYQPAVSNPIFNNPLVKYGAAISGILFFGSGIIYFSRKLADKKPGMIIDDEGIFDSAGAAAVGRIPWMNITRVVTAQIVNQQFLIIVVNNPEHYINEQHNVIKKKGMIYNFKHYGSPVAIAAGGLKCNLSELLEMLDAGLVAYRMAPSPVPFPESLPVFPGIHVN